MNSAPTTAGFAEKISAESLNKEIVFATTDNPLAV
jgi:hypothetical protein